jgi:hypothetical protein
VHTFKFPLVRPHLRKSYIRASSHSKSDFYMRGRINCCTFFVTSRLSELAGDDLVGDSKALPLVRYVSQHFTCVGMLVECRALGGTLH